MVVAVPSGSIEKVEAMFVFAERRPDRLGALRDGYAGARSAATPADASRGSEEE